jgi:IclR family transcriptional regulator, mhp operon transcriptional activator
MRAVARTLHVLQALNDHNGSTVTELMRRTALSRQAIYRILETLIEAGFVAAGRVPHTYKLTSRVRSLSRGYGDEALVAEVAAPVLDQLQKKVIWPTELATLRQTRMQLQDSTRHDSPMVIDGEVVGRTISMHNTALGLAYLSRCAPARRQALLTAMRATASASDPIPGERRMRQLLETARAKGYAWREGGIVDGHSYQTSTLAVPISARGDVRAALAITFFTSAMTIDEAARKYLSDLQRAAQTIERRLERSKMLGESLKRLS